MLLQNQKDKIKKFLTDKNIINTMGPKDYNLAYKIYKYLVIAKQENIFNDSELQTLKAKYDKKIKKLKITLNHKSNIKIKNSKAIFLNYKDEIINLFNKNKEQISYEKLFEIMCERHNEFKKYAVSTFRQYCSNFLKDILNNKNKKPPHNKLRKLDFLKKEIENLIKNKKYSVHKIYIEFKNRGDDVALTTLQKYIKDNFKYYKPHSAGRKKCSVFDKYIKEIKNLLNKNLSNKTVYDTLVTKYQLDASYVSFCYFIRNRKKQNLL